VGLFPVKYGKEARLGAVSEEPGNDVEVVPGRFEIVRVDEGVDRRDVGIIMGKGEVTGGTEGAVAVCDRPQRVGAKKGEAGLHFFDGVRTEHPTVGDFFLKRFLYFLSC
jgi:hypothetical protein